METLFVMVPLAAVLALAFAYVFYSQMRKESEGTPTMQEIAEHVRKGAMAYLKQQYKVVAIVSSWRYFLPFWPMAFMCRTPGFRSPS